MPIHSHKAWLDEVQQEVIEEACTVQNEKFPLSLIRAFVQKVNELDKLPELYVLISCCVIEVYLPYLFM